MSGVLTAQTVKVTTASVEIKTLTISGKQVTLAVFRQLPEAWLLDDNCHWRGRPWGHVNYKLDDFYQNPMAHVSGLRHVVMEVGGDLCRGFIADPASWFKKNKPYYAHDESFMTCEKYVGTNSNWPGNLLFHNDPEDYACRYHLRWNELQKLPQLFIAV